MEKEKFAPFDKVLVRCCGSGAWTAALFSHIEGNLYILVGGFASELCIPYEGNER